ncbi:MAG: TraB/GumN family protein [Steroidobacteraceae bacterium]
MMRRCLIILLSSWVGSVAAQEVAPASAPPEVDAALEELVITGMRTGPRLWQISKDDHVLWLLGVPDALPKDTTWQSRDVETAVNESQLVLAGMNVKATPGLFSMLPLYLQFRRMVRLPEDQTLKDWLSAESYQRFVTLQKRYLPKEKDLDQYHPSYVAQRFLRAARDAAGLNERINLQEEVLKLAKRHNVGVDRKTLTVDKPSATIKEVLKELSQMPRDKEVACLEASMARLETDVGIYKARANAWALGDVEALRKLQTRERSACWEALTSSPRLKQLEQQVQEYWFNTALKSLAGNRSTFGMRPIDELLGEGGMLVRFRAAGYQVSGP